MAYIDKIKIHQVEYDIKGQVDPSDISAITYNRQEINNLLSDKVNTGTVYTKQESDGKYQEKGDYVSASTLNNYYTKGESDAKYLTEHTPLKTINNQVISGTGNIEITASTITVDDALSTASTNPVQNAVITNSLNDAVGLAEWCEDNINALERYIKDDTSGLTANVYSKTEVNNLLSGKSNTGHTHTVSNITDFPTKLVSGQTQGYTISVLTQAEWEAITTPDNNVIYLIKETS